MGHLLEYSGIVTKTRAMESRLLSPGQFQELASLHTIPEAVEYLKKNTAYAETLESLEPTQLHRGNIEKLLTQSLYRDYTKLYRFCGQKQRKFMELRLKSYEIDLIDYCLRIVINHYKRPFDLHYKKEFFDRYSQLSIDRLITSRTTDELVESCLKEFENLPYREFAVHGVVVVDAMRKGEIIRGIPVVANADDFFEYVKNNFKLLDDSKTYTRYYQ